MGGDITTEQLGFAIVGSGMIAQVHARALAELGGTAQLRAVVGRNASTTAALAARYDAAATDDLAAVLADAEIDAVIDCGPSGTRAGLAVAALRAGKHVVLEKPMALTLSDADRIIAAERESGRRVAVVSQHRFERSAQRVAAAIRSGGLGTVTSVIASCAWWRGQSYYDSAAWRGTWEMDGGGAAMNQAIHVIDLMVFLLGLPTEVFAYTGLLAHQRMEVEDTAVAVVKLPRGALGLIHATTAAFPGLDMSLRVYGSRGSAVITDDELVFLHQNPSTAPEVAVPARRAELNQVTGQDRLTSRPTPLGPAHRAQLADFIDAVHTGRPMAVGSADGRATLSVVLGMYESARACRPIMPGKRA